MADIDTLRPSHKQKGRLPEEAAPHCRPDYRLRPLDYASEAVPRARAEPDVRQ